MCSRMVGEYGPWAQSAQSELLWSCFVRRVSSAFYLVHFRGHIFSLIRMKLDQNICIDEISNMFDTGPREVKN